MAQNPFEFSFKNIAGIIDDRAVRAVFVFGKFSGNAVGVLYRTVYRLTVLDKAGKFYAARMNIAIAAQVKNETRRRHDGKRCC